MSIGYDELQSFIGCGVAWAEERAQMAIELKEQFDAGELSEEEFMELMQDLVRADKLDEEADNLEMKAALVSAVYGVANII